MFPCNWSRPLREVIIFERVHFTLTWVTHVALCLSQYFDQMISSITARIESLWWITQLHIDKNCYILKSLDPLNFVIKVLTFIDKKTIRRILLSTSLSVHYFPVQNYCGSKCAHPTFSQTHKVVNNNGINVNFVFSYIYSFLHYLDLKMIVTVKLDISW